MEKSEAITLTPQETLVVQMICTGKSSEEVAEMLCILKRTVDFHLCNAYDKLRVANRIQLYIKAVQLGLIDPPVPISVTQSHKDTK